MIRALLPSCPTCTYTHGLPPCHVFQRRTSRAGVCILTHQFELDLASECLHEVERYHIHSVFGTVGSSA